MRIFLFILMPLLSIGQSKEKVLYEYFKSIGGIDNWAKIQSCRQVMDVWQSIDNLNVPLDKQSLIDDIDPARHLSIRKLPNFEFTQITERDGGKTNFYQNEKRSGIVIFNTFYENPMPNEYTTINIAVNILNVDQAGLIVYLGEKIEKGEEFQVLIGPYQPRENDNIEFYFNKSTHLLAFTKTGKPDSPIFTYYSDYRNVDGLMVYFKKESFAKKALFFREVTLEIEFNQPIEKSKFFYKPEEAIKGIINKPNTPPFKDGDLASFINSNYRGKRVFIDLWATWCAPCKIEFKKYDSTFYELIRNTKIEMVFISIDDKKGKKIWESEINLLPFKGDHFLSGSLLRRSIQKIVYNNGLVVIPRYILIDEDGKIISVDFKRPSHPLFRKEIEKYFPK